MTIPAYTVYSSHPRLYFRDTDKAAIAARVADSAGWKTLYDNTIHPAAVNYKGYTNAQLAGIADPHDRLMVLLLVGWLEETGRPDGGYRDRAVEAAVYLCGLSNDVAPKDYRHRLLALSEVFDVCYDWLTASEKSTIAGELVQQAGYCTFNEDEYMDGHSGNDQMCALAAGLAIHGYHSSATAIINRALEFWYGTGPAGGPDGGRWEMPRYACADGGEEKGSWYQLVEQWGECLISWFLWKATTAVNPFTDEVAWMKKRWEWQIWSQWTGATNHDYDAMGDTARVTNPLYHVYQRIVYSILADRFPNNDSLEGGYMLRWLHETYDALASGSADGRCWHVIFMDRAALTSRHPKDATTVPAISRLFSPPGVYYGRWAPVAYADWEYDQSCVIRISARKYYYLGHPHLDAGSCMIHFKGDRLLQAPAGMYDTYGGSHHMNAYQRTWLQSLAPLVHDPNAEWRRYSTLCASDGGQQFKKSPVDGRADPERVYWMKNDGGGEHWLRTRSFTKPIDDAPTTMTFLVADIEPGYRQKSTDEARCSVLETKYLIIWPNATNTLTWPAILYYARIIKADSSWRTQIPLHSYNTWTATSYGAYSTGCLGLGKLWLDIYNTSAYTKLNVPPGTPLDGYGFGPNQFRIYGDGPDNWKPVDYPNTREIVDLNRNSFYVEKTTRTTQEDYVFLLMISAIGDSEPVTGRTWVTESDFYGITLGADTYRVHKTQALAVHGSPDVTPPGEVTAAALAVRDRGLLFTYTDPVDSDLDKIRIFKRTSAIV
jgi:hypothetical protein